jgi:hypothetical protein
MSESKSKFFSKASLVREQIISKWGNSWNFIGDDFKRAIVTERVFHVFSNRENSTSPDEMSCVLEIAFEICGIR